jgi:uncharacterized OsmC-like protein
METRGFELQLRLEEGYRFEVDFGLEGVPPLRMDEPPPLGGGEGPSASRVLGAAIGNCLGSSLLFCLRRARVDVHDLAVQVAGTVERNEHGRLRITSVRVRLLPDVAPADRERMERCLGVFEDYCIVTQSVRQGLDVQVEVEPPAPAVGEQTIAGGGAE